MGIGLGIALLVVGAILAFAVSDNLSGIDLTMIGYILMGGGVLTILLALVIFLPRNRRQQSTAVITDSAGRSTVTERDDRISGL